MSRAAKALAAAAALAVLYFAFSYYSVAYGLELNVTSIDASVGGVVVSVNISNVGPVPVSVESVKVRIYTSGGVLLCEGDRYLGESVAPSDYVVTAVNCRLESGFGGVVRVLLGGESVMAEFKLRAGVGPVTIEKTVREPVR